MLRMYRKAPVSLRLGQIVKTSAAFLVTFADNCCLRRGLSLSYIMPVRRLSEYHDRWGTTFDVGHPSHDVLVAAHVAQCSSQGGC